MKLNRFFTAFFCFYILTAVQLWSQKTADEFIFVNLKDGMSKVAISTITQDNYGYIWIGTNGKGVYKFDGVEYVSYKYESTDSLSVNSSLIHCSYLDKKNRLWVGTENGINVYDRRIDKFKRIEFSKKQKGDSNNISVASVTGDEDGNIYLGTFGKGLFKLNSNTFNIEKIENNIKDVTESTNLTVNNLGVVTAASITDLTAGTVDVTGQVSGVGITLSGNVTASGYWGDGSNLTGVATNDSIIALAIALG